MTVTWNIFLLHSAVPGSSSRIIPLFAAADCVEDGEASQLDHPPLPKYFEK